VVGPEEKESANVFFLVLVPDDDSHQRPSVRMSNTLLSVFDRIFSAYQGQYSAKEILVAKGQQGLEGYSRNAADDEVAYDEYSISFDGGCADVVGRAFIEVGGLVNSLLESLSI
jgi:hypothetical protein